MYPTLFFGFTTFFFDRYVAATIFTKLSQTGFFHPTFSKVLYIQIKQEKKINMRLGKEQRKGQFQGGFVAGVRLQTFSALSSQNQRLSPIVQRYILFFPTLLEVSRNAFSLKGQETCVMLMIFTPAPGLYTLRWLCSPPPLILPHPVGTQVRLRT